MAEESCNTTNNRVLRNRGLTANSTGPPTGRLSCHRQAGGRLIRRWASCSLPRPLRHQSAVPAAGRLTIAPRAPVASVAGLRNHSRDIPPFVPQGQLAPRVGHAAAPLQRWRFCRCAIRHRPSQFNHCVHPFGASNDQPPNRSFGATGKGWLPRRAPARPCSPYRRVNSALGPERPALNVERACAAACAVLGHAESCAIAAAIREAAVDDAVAAQWVAVLVCRFFAFVVCAMRKAFVSRAEALSALRTENQLEAGPNWLFNGSPNGPAGLAGCGSRVCHCCFSWGRRAPVNAALKRTGLRPAV